MNDRYPSPSADRIWSKAERAMRMREVSDAYTVDSLQTGGGDSSSLVSAVYSAPPVDPAVWADAEAAHGHEIVGFVDAYLSRLPVEIHPHVHFGLTSSDLVEYDLHQALNQHQRSVVIRIEDLLAVIHRTQAKTEAHMPRAGRTHGRTAEATTLEHQLGVYSFQLIRIRQTMLALGLNVIKSPGPTGRGFRSIPSGFQAVPSTQIIPRDLILEWACSYLRLTNVLDSLAMFIRLGCRSEIDEFREGAASQRVGSSAMPGKSNPIQSERICGLARVARGYFTAIMEVSNLWEDRDLSNSSTERIAIPGLASTVEYMIGQAIDVLGNLIIYGDKIHENVRDSATSANLRQSFTQKYQKLGPIEASKVVASNKEGSQ